MSRRIRSTAVAVLASLALVTMASTASLAQTPYPPPPAFSVVCASTGQAGLSVACRVLGALANERLTATAAYNPEFYREDLVANVDGEANFRFTAPAEARGREITVTVTREDGSSFASDQLTIAAPGRTGEGVGHGRTGQGVGQGRLARTGQDVVLLGAAGLVLLTGGVLARRRSVTQRDRKRIDA